MAPLTIGFPFFQNVCPSVGGFDPHLGVTKNGVCIYTIKTPISIGKFSSTTGFWHTILGYFRNPPKNDENIVVDNNNNT